MSTPSNRRTLSPLLVPLRWALFGMVMAFGLSLVWFFVVGESLFADGVVGPITYGDFLLLAGIVVGGAIGFYRREP